MNFIVKKQVKKLLGTVNVSKEYYPVLENKIIELIKESKKRAIANGRKTVLARDI